MDSFKSWLPPAFNTQSLGTALSDCWEGTNPVTGKRKQSGKLNGLSVTAGSRGIIIEGSLPTYLLGNNLRPLSRQEVKDAIEKMSGELHLPVEKAHVWRVDMCANFSMQLPVIDYTSALLDLSSYQRDTWANQETVQFRTRKILLCFYNKLQKMMVDKIPIPENLNGANLLRYEARFRSRLGEQFERKGGIFGEDLYKESFVRKAVKKWEKGYTSILKMRRVVSPCTKGTKGYRQSLEYYGLKARGGLDAELERISCDRRQGKIDPDTAKRRRQLIRNIAKTNPDIEASAHDCIAELDEKVRQAAIQYMDS